MAWHDNIASNHTEGSVETYRTIDRSPAGPNPASSFGERDPGADRSGES
jgi:hypothetical protein